ncbi:MAG: hypothetical protein RL515_567 [Verrucomicrobiota bacterium]|jgi:hypothetical protein
MDDENQKLTNIPILELPILHRPSVICPPSSVLYHL